MVFSSFEFLFLFLPIVVFLYYFFISVKCTQIALTSLFLASLFYYAYWNPSNLWIIIVSIIWNFLFGSLITRTLGGARKFIFILGLLGNIATLFYFKYTDFAINTINHLINSNISLTNIILPIGISFFTFQQIAYLSDAYSSSSSREREREREREPKPLLHLKKVFA